MDRMRSFAIMIRNDVKKFHQTSFSSPLPQVLFDGVLPWSHTKALQDAQGLEVRSVISRTLWGTESCHSDCNERAHCRLTKQPPSYINLALLCHRQLTATLLLWSFAPCGRIYSRPVVVVLRATTSLLYNAKYSAVAGSLWRLLISSAASSQFLCTSPILLESSCSVCGVLVCFLQNMHSASYVLDGEGLHDQPLPLVAILRYSHWYPFLFLSKM
ncbi:hypothetical protein GWK47_003303 [Chionoecetes opilio]|uniref:Uncharacterized protein n=1 Tax=Chionoecetes opilio TaxID=41210 RepID=A0A8J4YT22_CHIOP|nr:hypothetical protein GWK47_003303 [Chionoecetes opilio]